MRKQPISKKTGNEHVKVSTSIDNGRTSIDIRVYPLTSRAARKGSAVTGSGKAAS